MGFPTWTLWGMGLAAAAALIAVALAFIAQSPRLISRLGLASARLDLRARNFTGYGLAFLLLAMGFFAAGVPLGEQVTAAATPNTAEPLVAGTIAGDVMDQEGPVPTTDVQQAISALETAPAAAAAGNSGAMDGSGLPTPVGGADTPEAAPADAALPGAEATPTTPPELLGTVPAASADTAAEATAVPPTATPEPLPSPTPSPTPIAGPTAQINDNTSTLSIRRTPGGEPLVQVMRGDTVLLLSGHAFHSGGLWREVATVTGVAGWVQERFLDYGASSPATH